MNKKALIISPYFPPANAADMQRIRMSLPYLKDFGWDVEVVTVDAKYSDLAKDELLLLNIPPDIIIHQIKAPNKKFTSKVGLGSLALRSLFFYLKKVNQLLKESHFDLIYFSTTQFPVCILGAYWKNRFKIPYVIDMQDPWHSDYYEGKPKNQQPNKYWFSYRMNKILESFALKQVDGLISVSEYYICDLKKRYPSIKNVPSATIPFGAYGPDLKIAASYQHKFKSLLDADFINIVYIGRGGADMHKAVSVLFKTFKNGLTHEPQTFKKIKLYFIGTSYAPSGQGKPTILPLAKQYGIEGNVIELTDRISYYHTLITLQQASALFIPGSDDPKYTASKIYPYLLAKKPVLAIFNSKSPALGVLTDYAVDNAYCYDTTPQIEHKIHDFLKLVANGDIPDQNYDIKAINKYSAESMTSRQCDVFDEVLNRISND